MLCLRGLAWPLMGEFYEQAVSVRRVGYSRLPRLPGVTRLGARRNPPSAQRVRLLGGLRAALLSLLDYRAVFSVANPPALVVL
jgi:hypothetical protein